ncbi:uncharacterized protein KGF55_001206 [Candida pseudojiufengensis]|uniref:uncharacterized protein n=1 Tax=Candida pseudojiufengensis TaxID=497109 RepID=UPI002224288E|nr:uncharacterized protein KGF55_001206 [Candida pseudojiufengensis]KAI5965843.1 hypothetical protein KGF55_001206 [Candida pseudojiufengensis]
MSSSYKNQNQNQNQINNLLNEEGKCFQEIQETISLLIADVDPNLSEEEKLELQIEACCRLISVSDKITQFESELINDLKRHDHDYVSLQKFIKEKQEQLDFMIQNLTSPKLSWLHSKK